MPAAEQPSDELTPDEATEPVEAPEPDQEPVADDPVEAPAAPATEAPDNVPLGVAPYARASAVALAETRASQLSSYRGASSPVDTEHLGRIRVQFLDQYDSRWQRDPGRANGPFS